ncbi:OmpA family protein [Vibrio salinus]|uniref:OmpA family protein n=1 Tax=Vibrio salinus TaxID=2899784 RepID=UPI001E2ED64C|nr:OmpA family protein [Vibrio salinus]MCE0494419.1 OmpA family protein [Vibrio salinus]
MKKLAVVSMSLLAVSTASMASMADGIYVGAKEGASWFNGACSSSGACDDNKIGLGGFVGYEMTDYLGIEAGYDYLGKIVGSGINNRSVSAITLAPKFSLPVYDHFSAYLKTGGAYVDYGQEQDMSYLAAVGAEYAINRHLTARLEYQKLTDINNDVVKANNNFITLGVSYKFGGAEPEPVVVREEPVAEPEPEPVVAPQPVVHTYKKSLNSSDSFALNSAVLTDSAKTHLQEVITFMNTYPQAMVTIVGHTDSTGSMKYNQMLSEQRANAVATYLEENGIDSTRIMAEGKGELEPIASNETRMGREQNRRVDITIPEFEYKVVE